MTQPSETIAPLADPEERTLQCMEIWGGNQAVNASVQIGGLDAWVYAKPYRAAVAADGGGDVYYVSSCAGGRITRLLLADVSGHGSAVADIAITLRTLMRSHVNHLDQRKFVRRMNQEFTEQSASGIFATAIVSTYFAPTSDLSLCNAGHPPPLIYRAEEKSWHFLDETNTIGLSREDKPEQTTDPEPANVPLGIIDMVDYEQFRVTLQPDDLVLCYTDSLPESRDKTGRMLGQQGLLNIVSSIDPTLPNILIAQLLKSLSIRCGGQVDGDDISILLIRPNANTLDRSFKHVIATPFRFISHLIRDAIQTRTLPLPDLYLANIGGAIIPSLGKLWRRK